MSCPKIVLQQTIQYDSLKMNDEEEIMIKGTYFQFGSLFNLLLKKVN